MHVHWHEGLFLQPHHLQLMQRGLRQEVRQARSLFNPYPYGVIESEISHDDLADGRLRFKKLRVIMPSGQEVYYPENADLSAPDLKAELARNPGAIEVLLAIPEWVPDRANAFKVGQLADRRTKLLYLINEVEARDENTGENPQSLHIRKLNARLALKGEDLSEMEFLPLLRVLRGVGQDNTKARLDSDFVPPSVLVRSSPVLHDLVRELAAQVSATRKAIHDTVVRGGHALEVKWELTMYLQVLNRFAANLSGWTEAGKVSPFAAYQTLRELHGELLALQPARTPFECEPYAHDDPSPAFRELDRRIRQLLKPGGPEPLKKVEFTGVPGKMRATLDAEDFEKPTGYYLAIKTRAERTKLALYLRDRDKFKFMPSSLEDVVIFGIELKELSYVPPALPGAGDLHYFSVQPSSNTKRWDLIKQEKAISLVWNNAQFDLADAAFTLYMTLPPSAP